ncbi:MAG: hypothetical protein AAFY57_18450 [Cyanobacteria bacterium J06642_2]
MATSIGAGLMPSEVSTTDDEAELLGQLIRNEARGLDPLDRAEVICQLIHRGWTDSELARRTGKSPSYIGKLANLACATPQVMQLIEQGKVAASTVMNTMRASREPEDVASVITEAVWIAEREGRKKATISIVKEVERRRAQANSSETSAREVVELRQRVCSVCWEQASLSVLRKVAKLLDKELAADKAISERWEEIRRANLSETTAANGRAASHTA